MDPSFNLKTKAPRTLPASLALHQMSDDMQEDEQPAFTLPGSPIGLFDDDMEAEAPDRMSGGAGGVSGEDSTTQDPGMQVSIVEEGPAGEGVSVLAKQRKRSSQEAIAARRPSLPSTVAVFVVSIIIAVVRQELHGSCDDLVILGNRPASFFARLSSLHPAI